MEPCALVCVAYYQTPSIYHNFLYLSTMALILAHTAPPYDSSVSTETNLAPNHELNRVFEDMSSVYPTAPTRFRWINSGTYMGRVKDIVHILQSMPQDFRCNLPVTGEKMGYADDQRCFHSALLHPHTSHLITLDHRQEIFYCLWDTNNYQVLKNGRVRSETGSEPCFLHGNGGTPILQDLIETIEEQKMEKERFSSVDDREPTKR